MQSDSGLTALKGYNIFIVNTNDDLEIEKTLMHELILRSMDVKIICFDDSITFELMQPQISAIRQPIKEISERFSRPAIGKALHTKKTWKTSPFDL